MISGTARILQPASPGRKRDTLLRLLKFDVAFMLGLLIDLSR